MRKSAEILKRLYEKGRVSEHGLWNAVKDGVITEDEYKKIVGEGNE